MAGSPEWLALKWTAASDFAAFPIFHTALALCPPPSAAHPRPFPSLPTLPLRRLPSHILCSACQPASAPVAAAHPSPKRGAPRCWQAAERLVLPIPYFTSPHTTMRQELSGPVHFLRDDQ